MANRSIEISERAFELACRAAALDGVAVGTYLESVVMRDAESISTREFLDGVPQLEADRCDMGVARLAA